MQEASHLSVSNFSTLSRNSESILHKSTNLKTRNLNSPSQSQARSISRMPENSPPVKQYIRSHIFECSKSVNKDAILQIDHDSEIESSYTDFNDNELNVSTL